MIDINTIFSGIQPTGQLHLGNYLGAIKQWIDLQNDTSNINIFCIVDLHAITIEYNNTQLYENILNVAATYLACGVDLQKSKIFIQSSVKEHVELYWLLCCLTDIGILGRMTQFKEKSSKSKNVSFGLYSYPVLMAADILLYNTTHVPVGEDQKQHLELARDIAHKFNKQFQELFVIPEPIIPKNCARIMSLKNGNNKMSKSDPSDFSRINLMDSAEIIITKIKKSKTDSITSIDYESLNSRPEIKNIISIFSSLSNQSAQEVCNTYNNMGFVKFKNDLAELLISHITPIQEEINRLMGNRDYLIKILAEGQEYCTNIAHKKMRQIKKIMGLYYY